MKVLEVLELLLHCLVCTLFPHNQKASEKSSDPATDSASWCLKIDTTSLGGKSYISSQEMSLVILVTAELLSGFWPSDLEVCSLSNLTGNYRPSHGTN